MGRLNQEDELTGETPEGKALNQQPQEGAGHPRQSTREAKSQM